jgi:hypothetical protein
MRTRVDTTFRHFPGLELVIKIGVSFTLNRVQQCFYIQKFGRACWERVVTKKTPNIRVIYFFSVASTQASTECSIYVSG